MTRWKTKEECQHVKHAKILEFQGKIQTKNTKVRGSMEYLLGKVMEVE